MLHPILPPTPPVISTVQSPAITESAASDSSSAQKAPENFSPEFSTLSSIKSAAALGDPLSIGYPILPGEVSNFSNSIIQDAIAATRAKSLSSQKPQKQAQKIAQNQPVTAAQPAPQPQQPTIRNVIEFKTRNQNGSETTSNSTAQQITVPQQPTPAPPEQITVPQPTPAPPEQTPAPQPTPAPPEQIPAPQPTPAPPEQIPAPQPTPAPPEQTPAPQQTPGTSTPPVRERVIEVIADRQEYDQTRQIVTAEGNVVVRFDGAVVDADRLQVNLDNLIAVGDGDVALTRGDQVLRGQRFTYNFIQDSGNLDGGSGEIFIPTAGQDLSFAPTTGLAPGGVPARPLSDRIRRNQPLTGVGSPGGVDVTVGGRANATNLNQPKQGGSVRRLRFQAMRIEFYPRGWQARDVRITNDPFSPPELELRANKVTLTQESPLVDRINTDGQRLVFDQGLSLPIPVSERVIDRNERSVTPGIASIGFDGEQRGGLFVERDFQPFRNEQFSWTVTPQFLAQKAINGGGNSFADLFGLKTRVDGNLGPQTQLQASGILNSLDLSKAEDNLRASLRLRQTFGELSNPYTLGLEYSYRDRLYNGTLGFQRVQSSLGAVLTSPVIPLGTSGFNLNYQASTQYINANTDRLDLLEADRDNNRISLGRFQATAGIGGGIPLWQGKPLPATANEGLKYTPNPVVPYISATLDLRGTTSYYTNGDNQSTLTASVGLQGQFGHFSRDFLDYTAFRVVYSQGLNSGQSPFLFDRSVDNRVLSAGISQQIYGPFRLGLETSLNLDTGESLSTDYTLEYSRRTYGIVLRYNPVQELGGISFRISDFNWSGGTDPFSDRTEFKPVSGGVEIDR